MSRHDSDIGESTHESEDSEIDLREYLGIIADGWRWILLGAICGLIVAGYFAWKQAPIYQATSLMRVEKGENMAPAAFMQQQASGSGGAVQAVTAEAAIVHSRSVVGAAVEDEHLQVRTHPRYFPVVGEPLARWLSTISSSEWGVPGLSGYAWGNVSANVTQIKLAPEQASAHFTLVSRGSDRYRLLTPNGEKVLEGQVGKTASGVAPDIGPVKIFVKSLSAASGTQFGVSYVSKAAAIASVQARLQVKEQPQGSGLLDLTLSASSPAEAQRQLNAVMSSYLQKSVEQQSQQAQQRLEFLKKQLPKLKEDRDQAQAKLASYQSETGTLDLSSKANAVLQQLTNLDQQLAKVDINRQELLQEYTQKHPLVQAANDKRSTLEARRDKLQKQLKALPKSESKLLELRRNAEVKDQLYTTLLNTSQGLQISKAGITGVTHIIDSAYAPGGKVSPKRGSIMAIGLLAGGVISVLIVLAGALLRSRLEDPDVMESKYGLPVYATVPLSEAETKRRPGDPLLATQDSDDTAVESLRALRTSLQFAMMAEGTRFVAITGPTPACGKSFVSANLGALLAHSGNRVLLVDGDMRRGQLYKTMGLKQSPGLSDVLSSSADVAGVIQSTQIEHLDVLATGKRPPNPSELLMSGRIQALKTELETQYDYVLFDLPPLLNVTDASLIAQHMTATFLVVRSDHSTGHEVQQSIKRMDRDGLKLNGAIFNGLKLNSMRYGYSKYRYYSYKY